MAGGRKALPHDVVSEIGVEDLYEFLGVSSESSEKEITSGYRKKALKYHPDKNPDDPNASDRFQKLSKAYSILTDPAAKAAYDKWLRAKFAAQKRHAELNAKRKKLKESLESRESQHAQDIADEAAAAKRMQREIERLREEGFKKIKEQEELLRQQLIAANEEDEDSLPTLKVTWKAKKSDETNGGYSQQLLEDILSKFGPVHHILVSQKRKGKAVVSFYHPEDACLAVEAVCGLENNHLKLSWLSGEPRCGSVDSGAVRGDSVDSGAVRGDSVESVPFLPAAESSLQRETDYESITLMRLRQAEERKRLAQQLAQEDAVS